MDLGGTKLATAIVDADGALHHRASVPLGGRRGHDVASLIIERCEAACARLRELGEGASAGKPAAVGITVPGIYRAAQGTVWAPNIPEWDDYPLRDALVRALGADVPVVIDSDRAAYVLGETWLGAARGARHAIVIAVGTGIGAGIMVDGTVLRGASDIAGAIGWLALDRPFREPYVSCGCFEHHASGPGLVKVALALLDGGAGDDDDAGEDGDASDDGDTSYDGELRRMPRDAITTAHIFAAYDRGDAVATRVLDDAIAYWGMAAANLVSLFNPEVIVFGGGVFGPAARFIDRIRDEAVQWAQPIAVRETRFVASTLHGDAGLFGAARLAMLASGEALPTKPSSSPAASPSTHSSSSAAPSAAPPSAPSTSRAT
ncbi:MAG TPA: ROK family protein [Gemmatimonadaceae bacterium]